MKNIEKNPSKAEWPHFIVHASFQANGQNKLRYPLGGILGWEVKTDCVVMRVLESGVVREERGVLFNKHGLKVWKLHWFGV